MAITTSVNRCEFCTNIEVTITTRDSKQVCEISMVYDKDKETESRDKNVKFGSRHGCAHAKLVNSIQLDKMLEDFVTPILPYKEHNLDIPGLHIQINRIQNPVDYSRGYCDCYPYACDRTCETRIADVEKIIIVNGCEYLQTPALNSDLITVMKLIKSEYRELGIPAIDRILHMNSVLHRWTTN